ncbi:MAG: CHC2 zinc finger domain-containing protein [Phycisphaerae bacterium]|jgi:DNA primase|nr:CHC2 zinc finger domain-containing protein [Phycisphaerae bacterium]|tara:strand:+ start:981 stop:1307 length:327 start_codon:yes stop_codon:yes gene_type:complete
MARNTKRHGPSLRYARLREQITMEQVLSHLGHLARLRGSGPQRRGPCPVHSTGDPTDRSFAVHLQKNVFYCFAPQCQAAGTVLDLWAAVHRLPLPEAARHMAETFGIR